jgi:hypothetical protein
MSRSFVGNRGCYSYTHVLLQQLKFRALSASALTSSRRGSAPSPSRSNIVQTASFSQLAEVFQAHGFSQF